MWLRGGWRTDASRSCAAVRCIARAPNTARTSAHSHTHCGHTDSTAGHLQSHDSPTLSLVVIIFISGISSYICMTGKLKVLICFLPNPLWFALFGYSLDTRSNTTSHKISTKFWRDKTVFQSWEPSYKLIDRSWEKKLCAWRSREMSGFPERLGIWTLVTRLLLILLLLFIIIWGKRKKDRDIITEKTKALIKKERPTYKMRQNRKNEK